MAEKKPVKTVAAGKKPMTKTELISHLTERTGLSKKDVTLLLDEITNLAYKKAKIGFVLPGIGKLVVVKQKARMGRNPQTGEAIKIPAKKAVKFRVAKACKEAAIK